MLYRIFLLCIKISGKKLSIVVRESVISSHSVLFFFFFSRKSLEDRIFCLTTIEMADRKLGSFQFLTPILSLR